MASLSNHDGTRRLYVLEPITQKRWTIYLGKITKQVANEIKLRVERICGAKASGSPLDPDTARWLREISSDLAEKLANAGLIGERSTETLGGFTQAYIDGRTDIKPRTRINLSAGRRHLVEFFGEDRPLGSITPGDADAWGIWMKGKYADATVGREVKWARQFFKAAIRKRLVTENPFLEVKAPGMVNSDRLFFVTREMAEKVLDACPTPEWRAIFALARYGGLRCPSEVLALTWGDIRWDEGKFRVRSSKLEHNATKGVRWVPLFPELRPHLEALFDAAEPGTIHVITKTRSDEANLRTHLERIVYRGTDLVQ